LARDRGIDPGTLVASAAAGDWDEITSREWRIPKNAGPTLISRALSTGRRIGSLFNLRSRGLCVAVIGPDGAGKSTLVGGLQQTLPFRTRRIYMGLTGGRMRRAQLLRVPGLIFAAQGALLWARYLHALLRSADGEIVLFERYVLDGAVSAGTPLSALQQLSRRVQRWIVPPVDLVLLLDASGRTMFDRKGEYSSGTLETWRAQYRKLERSVRNVVVIDAEQTAEAVLKTAQAAIWSRLRRRAAA
jgi:thymidylate kinase